MPVKSANVTGLPIMGDMGVAPQRAVASGEDGAKANVDFQQLIARSISDGGKFNAKDRTDAATVREFAVGRKDISSFESPTKDNTINVPDDGQDMSYVSKEGKEKASGVMDEIGEAIEDTVTEALGITEEQLEDAMEVLGLTFAELLDPSNMQTLMQQISADGMEADLNLLAITPEELVASVEDQIAPILENADLSPE